MLSLVKTITKQNLKAQSVEAWTKAGDQLGLSLQTRAATAQGTVGGYDVFMSLVTVDSAVHTKYVIELDAPHAPEFTLTASKRSAEAEELAFEDLVDIATDDRLNMLDFLTRDRREIISSTIERWHSTVVTASRVVVVGPEGAERDSEEIVSSIEHLVALADAMSPCWTEVALDEGAVLGDLFSPTRSVDQVSERFDRLYKAGEVTWTGEILQVGEREKRGRRAVVLVGASSAPSKFGTMWGGRVVAITLLDPDTEGVKGDVVTFSGALRNLDAAKRLFRIEDSSTWKLSEPVFAAV